MARRQPGAKMQDRTQPKIALVGCGPRGLGALEALATGLPQRDRPLSVDVFDTFATLGAGPNFDPQESPVCRLNIPMRDIEIRPPETSTCGPFGVWLGQAAPGPDAFPQRAELGRYLEARYADLVAHPALSLTHRPQAIEELKNDADGCYLRGDGWFGPYAEVLLTIGQPEVRPDEQLAAWQVHARRSSGELAQAYPARALSERAADWVGRNVAIRGLALSAFDVIRVLTVGQGGRFEHDRYIPSGREPSLILPFSFDGRPPFPKPGTEALDLRFAPSDAESAEFLQAMTRAAVAAPDAARKIIDASLLPVVRRILTETGGDDDSAAIARWLDTEWASPGSQESGGAVDALRHGIAMAEGKCPPGIGYTVGQVWRKWQDEVRQGYNPAETPAETAKLVVGFDEGLKRYSYGLPVSSCHEVLMLTEAGLVDMELSADPEIDLLPAGWLLRTGGRERTADIMVDGVLPSPDLSIVTAPMVAGLLSEGRLCTVAEGLGGTTAADGTVLGTGATPSPGLSFLGRLALGSVIAADSLHDCFGEGSRRWAEGVVGRLGSADVPADP